MSSKNTDWNAIREKKDELLQEVPEEIKEKFLDVSGIYGIYIQDNLVYVGQSKSLLNRWVAHKINTLYDYGQHDYKEEKYAIFREAYQAGFSICCKPIEFCEPKDLNVREWAWISELKPILNGGHNEMVYFKGSQFLEKLEKIS